MKENVELGIRESYLGVQGSITLRTGDVFEVTKMCGGCKLERDGIRIYATEGFDTLLMEESERMKEEICFPGVCRIEIQDEDGNNVVIIDGRSISLLDGYKVRYFEDITDSEEN
jgi:hypothetical protein